MNRMHLPGEPSLPSVDEPLPRPAEDIAPAGDASTSVPVDRFVQLPTDVPRSSTTGFEAATTAWMKLDVHPGPSLQADALGSLIVLLYRYTQQTQISIDLRTASSEQPADLNVSVTGSAPVSQLIDEVHLRYTATTDPSKPAVDGCANVAATFAIVPDTAADSAGINTVLASTTSNYDVHFVLAQTRGEVLLALAYNARLFRASSMNRLMESYAVMLGAARQDPTIAVEQLPAISIAGIRALTVEQDSGTACYPPVPVHQLFQSLAKMRPTALAASFQGQQLTYGELDERSNRLAHELLARGVGPEIAVAVCVRPSLDILVSMLAIWKARGLYLPLDPTHPETLIGRMLDEARPKIVLTTSVLAPLTPQLPQLLLDADISLLAQHSSTAPAIEPSLDDAAYLFYTSGTTGKPKGVVATQGNLAQYIHSAAQKYGFRSGDVFSSLARYTFSISLFELISPLCCGGSLRILDRDEVLTPERLHRALEDVTVLHAGPSLLWSLFRHLRLAPSGPHVLPRMRHASSGGDMVAPSVMEEMKRVFPNAELFVIYGCTEVSCMGTTYPISRATAATRTFVGKPFPNVTSRVLDPNRNLVPFGVVGEICFAGKGIVRGYLDRPELTAEKFVEIEDKRFYQTGDMGRLHPDGSLEILGRRDFQVQLRGIRIELAGIEKTIQELGLAAQCAVVAKTMGEEDVRLIAFLVKPRDPQIASFRRALAAELPDYMLPHHLVVLDAMPLTANGKLDRNRLKEMPLQVQLQSEGRKSASNEREQKIADVFARVLGLDKVGVDESFFDLGGNSLLGVVLLEEIQRVAGVAIPPSILFESGTVESLARHSDTDIQGEPRPILLNEKVDGTPLFMLSGVHIYRELAKRLDGRCTAYGVFTKREVGAFDPASGRHSVHELARDYLQIIRAEQPKGPYRLLGYSFAGFVAYEVAQQIRAAGEEVSLLTLLDTYFLEYTRGWKFRLAQLARLPFASPRDVAAFVSRRLRERKQFGAAFVSNQEDEKLMPLEKRRDIVNRAAAAEYMSQIRPYAGEVTLIVSGTRLRDDPLKSRNGGWSPYVRSLDIESIDAHHLRMISGEPYVSEVAAILSERM